MSNKKIAFGIAVLLWFVGFASGYAQTQILAFHFNGADGKQITSNSTTTNANLQGSVLSRGAGAPAGLSSSTNTFNTNMVYAATKQAAKANNSYFEFFVQAKPGYFVSLTGLDAVLRIQTNSAKTYRWMYSLDNGVNFTEIGENDVTLTDLNNSGTVQPQIPITNLYNISSATKIIFRLYAWGGNNIVDNATTAFSIGKSASTLNAISVKGFVSNVEVPGKVLGHKSGNSGVYLGSPSICKLPNGNLVASNDYFGPSADARIDGKSVTRIYRSTDGGQTWAVVTDLIEQSVSTLFVHQGNLYIMGVSGANGNVVIRKSVDEGNTWTTPTNTTNGIIKEGRHHTAPTPVIEHNGRLWRAMEDTDGEIQTWPKMFRAFMMSVPVNADLLNASNWVSSNALPYDAAYVGGYFYGWLEGNAVVAPDGNMLNIARVHTFDKYVERIAFINVNSTGTTASFNSSTGFKTFPGGGKKFTIRYDNVTGKYWTLSNYVPVEYQGDTSLDVIRNTLALCSSTDLINWDVVSIVLSHPDTEYHAFQYVDWIFDSNDILAVSRTAYDDGLGGANSAHNSNYITFHRIKNYATEPVLALNATSFKAKVAGSKILLQWEGIGSTERLKNVTQNPYEVYKIAGNNKQFLGAVVASAERNSYSFVDQKPQNGDNYYQLKQVSNNGVADFSEVIAVRFKIDDKTDFAVVKNTENTAIKVVTNNLPNGMATLKITDMYGRKVQEIPLKLEQGINTFQIPVWLGKGVYIATLLSQDGQPYTTKFIF